jgi:hypothetical protein
MVEACAVRRGDIPFSAVRRSIKRRPPPCEPAAPLITVKYPCDLLRDSAHRHVFEPL